MRPDEHKKKKNAKYKKKHGLDSKQATNVSGEKDEAVTLSYSNQGKTETNSKKVYSRRVIKSNWEKYDEPVQQTEQIGDDLEQVVSSAGGASSHRILDSEKDWTVDQNLDEILSINFQQLADSLLEIPFCERLGLDENLFEPSLLKFLNDEKNVESNDSQIYPLNFSFSEYEFDFKPHSQKDSAPKEKNFSQDNSQNLSKKNNFKDTENVLLSTAKSSGPHQIPDKNNDDMVHPNSNKLSEKLAFSSPVSQVMKNQELDNLELELDSLLENTPISNVTKTLEVSKPTTSHPSLHNQETSESATEPDKSNEQEELEDWLDSII